VVRVSAKTLLALIRLARPTFLAGGIVGGVLGTVTALVEGRAFEPAAYALAQGTITSFHLMTQYANDYFDRAGDELGDRTEFSGGSGVLAEGSLSAATALRAALVCAGCGAIGVAALVGGGSIIAASLAVVMAAGAWTYSAPPLRLCARGLGEIDTTLVVAVLVPLVAYAAQARGVDLRALAVTLPAAAAMLAMMIAVEVPDLAADRASRKRNLVVRLGRRGAGRLGRGAVVALFAAAVPCSLALGAPITVAPFALLTVPLAAALYRGFGEARAALPGAAESLAGRGVALFFLTAFGTALGEATLLR